MSSVPSTTAAFLVSSTQGYPVSNVSIFNNTLANGKFFGTLWYKNEAPFKLLADNHDDPNYHSGISDVYFANNIIDSVEADYVLSFEIKNGATLSGYVSENNLISNITGSGVFLLLPSETTVVKYGAANIIGTSPCQDFYSCARQTETNSLIAASPLFVDSAAYDFHLAARSPAINRGSEEVINYAPDFVNGVRTPRVSDMNGQKIVGAPDIGAFEYPPAELSVSISDSPDPVLHGGTVTYEVMVSNSGPSEATDIALSGLPGCTLSTTLLPSGATTGCMTTITAETLDPITQTVVVNSNEADSSLINNRVTVETTVKPAVDLSVASLTVAQASPNLIINDQITNSGVSASGAFSVSHYLSADAIFNAEDAFLCERKVATLDGGTSDPATGTVQSVCAIPSVAGGVYQIIAVADSAGGVTETNEANNHAVSMVRLDGIDLLPTAFTASRFQNVKVLVTDTVKNQGTTSSSGFYIRYYLSTDTTYQNGVAIALAKYSNGTGICERKLSSLANGETSSDEKACYKPLSAANGVDYYVLVVDDATAVRSEYNESNNVLSTAGTIKW